MTLCSSPLQQMIIDLKRRKPNQAWAAVNGELWWTDAGTLAQAPRLSRAAESGMLLFQHRRHRFKNTVEIGNDAHTHAARVP